MIDTILVSYNNSNKNNPILLVGKRLPNGTTDIVNAKQGKEAEELYKLLTTVKK